MVYRLNDAGGFGEPLTPRNCDRFLDYVGQKATPDSARSALSRMSVSDLLAPDAWKTTGYKEESAMKWRIYHNAEFIPRGESKSSTIWIWNEKEGLPSTQHTLILVAPISTTQAS
jgi:hypothetical protein